MNAKLRERLARALASSQARDDEGEYERLADLIVEAARTSFDGLGAAVDAILTELEAAGYAVVPAVPTEQMVDAGARYNPDAWITSLQGRSIYTAMLKAKPTL